MSLNKNVIDKVEWQLSDLQAAGVLPTEVSDRFIRTMIAQPTLLNVARKELMSTPQKEINKILFGTRILHPAPAQNTQQILANRSAPTTSQITLTSKKVMATIPISYDIFEDNIERGDIGGQNAPGEVSGFNSGLQSTIIDLIAERTAVDMEELAISGDTASGDPFLALNDGWLKLSAANIVDVASGAISKGMFKSGLAAMPVQFLRNMSTLRHFVHTHQEIEYRDQLASRETTLGDSNINNINAAFGLGVPVAGANLMPLDQGLLVDPRNLIFGIQRDIMMEVERRPSEQQFLIIVTLRVDFKVEEINAVVRYDNIATP